jgi:hypothetical protein
LPTKRRVVCGKRRFLHRIEGDERLSPVVVPSVLHGIP